MKWIYKEVVRLRESEWRVKTRFAWKKVRTTLPSNDVVIWLGFYQTNDRFECGRWVTHQVADMNYWSYRNE